MVIQEVASCLRQPSSNTRISSKWLFHVPEITKTTFTTAGGVKNTTGFWRDYRQRGHHFQIRYWHEFRAGQNLLGRLLLIHGDIDNNVHPGNNSEGSQCIDPCQQALWYAHPAGTKTRFRWYDRILFSGEWLIIFHAIFRRLWNSVDIPQMYND